MSGRTLSAAAQAEIAKTDNALGWLIEIQFQSFTGRYSPYGDVTWNGVAFSRAPVTVSGLSSDSGSVALRFFDEDASLRTLCLSKPGVRNRPMTVWHFYPSALGASDPFVVFKGVGDEFSTEKGYVTITGARNGAKFLQAPRKRLGPSTGCNFLAAPGTIVPWGDAGMILEPSSRG